MIPQFLRHGLSSIIILHDAVTLTDWTRAKCKRWSKKNQDWFTDSHQECTCTVLHTYSAAALANPVRSSGPLAASSNNANVRKIMGMPPESLISPEIRVISGASTCSFSWSTWPKMPDWRMFYRWLCLTDAPRVNRGSLSGMVLPNSTKNSMRKASSSLPSSLAGSQNKTKKIVLCDKTAVSRSSVKAYWQ